MEEREQRRRCRGQIEAGERGLLQEAAGGIPRALAMTDGRVAHRAAEAWRASLTLEHLLCDSTPLAILDLYGFASFLIWRIAIKGLSCG